MKAKLSIEDQTNEVNLVFIDIIEFLQQRKLKLITHSGIVPCGDHRTKFFSRIHFEMNLFCSTRGTGITKKFHTKKAQNFFATFMHAFWRKKLKVFGAFYESQVFPENEKNIKYIDLFTLRRRTVIFRENFSHVSRDPDFPRKTGFLLLKK